jgi:hypothetical protein
VGLISRLFAVGFLAASLTACAAKIPVDDPGEAVGGPPAQAEAHVDSWFARVISGAPDLGWSLIDPRNRDLFGGEANYRAAITTDDWSGVHYRIGTIDLSDGEYRVHVELALDEGATLPTFFQRYGFVQGQPTNSGFAGYVVVRLGIPGEPSGIQAVGG